MRFHHSGLLLCFGLILVALPVHSQVRAWTGGGSNADWSTAANWSGNQVPTSSDSVVFSNTAATCILNVSASVRAIAFTSGYTGEFDFLTNTLTVTGGTADFRSGGNMKTGSGKLVLAPVSSMTLIPTTDGYLPPLHHDGPGRTVVKTNPLGTHLLSLVRGTFALGNGLHHKISILYTNKSSTQDTLEFGTSILEIRSCDGRGINFAEAGYKNASAARIVLSTNNNCSIDPPVGVTFGKLTLNKTGNAYGLRNGNLSLDTLELLGSDNGNSGLNLGNGLTHTIGTLIGSGNRTAIRFSTSTLRIAGDADFSGLRDIIPDGGSMEFIKATGVQTLITRPGDTLPVISKSSAGTLRFSAHSVLTHGLAISGGTLDFNGQNLAVIGDLSVTHGVASTFSGLGSRTLTIGGNATFNGEENALLGLDPSSEWTVKVSGTLRANRASVARSNATGSQGVAEASVAGEGNVNWDIRGEVGNCIPIFEMPPDTSMAEGDNLTLTARADCAVDFGWITMSHDAPPTPGGPVKSFTIRLPRVAGTKVLEYLFVADFGDSSRQGVVRITVQEAIPEPIFTLPSVLDWNGRDSLRIKPEITNMSAILSSPDSIVNYQWSFSGLDVDAIQGENELFLISANQSGLLNVSLCLDNDGPQVCRQVTVSVQLTPSSLRNRMMPTQVRNASGVQMPRFEGRGVDGRLGPPVR